MGAHVTPTYSVAGYFIAHVRTPAIKQNKLKWDAILLQGCIILFYYIFYVWPVCSERELKFMFAIGYRPSVCLSVCRLSVCNVRAPYSGD